MPILDADASLIPPFIDEMQRRLSRLPGAMARGGDIHTLVQGPGMMLFRLVILRSYLGRQPCDDPEIYRIIVQAVEEVDNASEEQKQRRRMQERTKDL